MKIRKGTDDKVRSTKAHIVRKEEDEDWRLHIEEEINMWHQQNEEDWDWMDDQEITNEQ